jgi:dipeptidyl-peptidase-4
MKFLFLIFFSLTLTLNLDAQITSKELANYGLAERFSTKKVSKLIFSTSVIPYWFKNSDRFWYIFSNSKETKYYIVDPANRTKKEIFDNAKLASQLSEIVGDPFDASNMPIGRFMLRGDTVFTFEVVSSSKQIKDPKSGITTPGIKIHGFEYNFDKNILSEVVEYAPKKFYPVWGSISPDKKYVVFSQNFNLYYISWEDYEKSRINPADTTIREIQLTFDGKSDFSYGPAITNFTGIEKERSFKRRPDIAWSPDSRKFALIITDQSSVKDLWVVNSLSNPRPELEIYKYHMPGEKEAPTKHLYLFDMEAKSFKKLSVNRYKDQDMALLIRPQSQKSKFDDYKFDIWEGDSDNFFFTCTSRDHKRVDLLKVNTLTDSIKSVIEERSNTYIETRHPSFINDNIFWWSERDGWAHLYRYDLEGRLKNRVTSGSYHIEEIVAADTINGFIYATANGVIKDLNPYYSHQIAVSFNGLEFKILNPGNYNNKTYTSDNGGYFVNNYSRVNTVPSSSLYDKSGKLLMELEKSDFSQLFMSGYRFPEPFITKAADGITNLYGVMYKPFDFDSSKVYPIIEYVYPGPHTEAVNYSWSSDMNETDRLAQLGFIVVTVGNRGGHPSRSKWYHNYGYGNLRDYGIEDKKRVLENLASKHNYIDIKRVGIHGHSGGGFMSATAMFLYPDFFKVAISASGNHDNKIYNRWWGEQHQGVDEVVTEKGDTIFKFKVDDNMSIAKNLRGRLLLITGDIDNNVHPANTLRLVNALIRANKRFDLLVLPGQRHFYTSFKEYVFWIKADYFSKHLLGNQKNEIDIIELLNN